MYPAPGQYGPYTVSEDKTITHASTGFILFDKGKQVTNNYIRLGTLNFCLKPANFRVPVTQLETTP